MKPWLALNQLNIPFELTLIDVLSGQQSSKDYLRINPLGVVPYLVADDGKGLGESNAMLWYICDGTDLVPKSAAERAEALQWMFFEQTQLEPFIAPARFFNFIRPSEKETRSADIATWKEKALPGLARLNDHLCGRQFMLDTGYSVADISIFGYVHVLEEAGLKGADFPHIMAWIARVRASTNFVELEDLGNWDANAA